ncbi:nicotinate-nucleotide adenylyltransferase [Celerinatantimonas sp. YJH-8]|uniref:nicotinate-nucleotide adenylyltransferase n=1 Tax=Celerinatantimonas sp. YJH-8 TaxID=3228714 RepID=UPI0038C50EF7
MAEPRLYLGGSFDPVHLGHLQSIEQLRQQIGLSNAVLIPAKRSPLKNQTHVSDQHRLMMLQLALTDYPQLHLDTREVYRSTASYTILTLQQLRVENPDSSLIFAMGMDSFLELNRWQHWRQLTDYAHLVVFSRPNYQPQLNPEIQQWLAPHFCQQISKLHTELCGQVYFTELKPYNISSSEIRQRLAQGHIDPEVKANLPVQVYNYLQQNSLYGLTPLEKP